MAGASKELSEAIIINPNDIPGLADALLNALQMPVAEQHERMSVMRKTVEKFNIHHWVKLFMQRLKEVKNMQQSLATRQLSTKTFDLIQKNYDDATKRIIFLDYDGTLVGFNVNPRSEEHTSELQSL